MEENKLFNEIKSAAENAEGKDFPAMEKVWQRVEEKLDKKEDKKAILLWKKIAVAACLLLFGTLGYQFLKNEPNQVKPNETITATDSIQPLQEAKDAVVTTGPSHPAIKENAEQILQKEIKPANQVALEEVVRSDDAITSGTYRAAPQVTNSYGLITAEPASLQSADADKKEDAKIADNKDKGSDVEMFIEKRAKMSDSKKEDPLVIIDDKVSRKNIRELEFIEGDSLIVLKEPLYIINGVQYTEQEVFGPNPTSPYTPLNKQEIETFSVLQNEKAIEIYGKKGAKGVVIITTKNGKPISANAAKPKK